MPAQLEQAPNPKHQTTEADQIYSQPNPKQDNLPRFGGRAKYSGLLKPSLEGERPSEPTRSAALFVAYEYALGALSSLVCPEVSTSISCAFPALPPVNPSCLFSHPHHPAKLCLDEVRTRTPGVFNRKQNLLQMRNLSVVALLLGCTTSMAPASFRVGCPVRSVVCPSLPPRTWDSEMLMTLSYDQL